MRAKDSSNLVQMTINITFVILSMFLVAGLPAAPKFLLIETKDSKRGEGTEEIASSKENRKKERWC